MSVINLTDRQVTSKVLNERSKSSKSTDPEDFSLPAPAIAEKLNEKATEKLSEIVRRSGAKEKGWRGYDESELAAARELLSKESSSVVR